MTRSFPWRRCLKWFFIGGVIISVVVGICVVIADQVYANPGYHGPVSDHWDGRQFQNSEAHAASRGLGGFLRWQMERQAPPAWREVPVIQTIPQLSVDNGTMRVTWVGHSTVLVQAGGVNILTDPIWSFRASPVSWAGPRRYAEPGIRFEDLPPIHGVLMSHDHYDHCDRETLRRLSAVHAPVIITGLGNDRQLASAGITRVTALDWWQSTTLSEGVEVTAVPVRHFSARALSDRNHSLWCGFVVKTPAGSWYFSGDTGWGHHFAEVGQRFPGLRLALLPIGAYLPRSIMSAVHVNPDEAVRAAVALGASTSLAIHWGTFALADDPQDQPPHDLQAALSACTQPPRFWVFRHGEQRDVP